MSTDTKATTMRRRLALLAAISAIAVLGAVPAGASELCYDLDVNVNGEQVVDEAACEVLPDLPF